MAGLALAGFVSPYSKQEVEAALASGDTAILEDANVEHVATLNAEEWDAYRVVRAMATQWSRGLEGIATGLRYEALPIVSGTLGIEIDEPRFQVLRFLEATMIEKWAEARKANAPPKRSTRSRGRR